MAHKNYRRKNKQDHHHCPSWYGKPTKWERFVTRKMVRQNTRLSIIHEDYENLYGDCRRFSDWWW